MSIIRRTSIDRKAYKGYDLFLCWCGYPQTRWLVMYGGKWKGTFMYLKDAKAFINQQ